MWVIKTELDELVLTQRSEEMSSSVNASQISWLPLQNPLP
jgi:hypothetical protein